ncbi:MAG: AAA family ATPase [Streptosporangiales bacterium]
MLKRFILTGAPGSGKTAILHGLRDRNWAVVEEAATEVIAREQARGTDEPWKSVDFVTRIAVLQRERQQRPVPSDVRVQFHDRSPFCTLALARYLRLPVTPVLADEIERVTEEQVYERSVFFVRPLGFVQPTAARRITYHDALAFETVHENVYREYGFTVVDVPVTTIDNRTDFVEAHTGVCETRPMDKLTHSESTIVATSPERLYDLVSDVTRTGEWSPICKGCWWHDDGGPQEGARFTGRNEAEGRVWETESEVVAAQPGREFAWLVGNKFVRWGYTLEPVEGGTRLTESWQFRPEGIEMFHQRFGSEAEVQINKRAEWARTGIPATLAAIKGIAESG